MNYLELINNYWDLREQGILSGNEGDCYLFLIHKCNRLNWKNPFNLSNQLCCGCLGIQEKSLIKYRNKLKQIGLIDFKSGTKGFNTEYLIIPCKKDSHSGRDSGSHSGSVSGSHSGENLPDYLKPKPIDTKQNSLGGADLFFFNSMEKSEENIRALIDQHRPAFIEPYIAMWNIFAARHSLNKASITKGRKELFADRIKEMQFNFLAVLDRAAASEQFLLKQKWFSIDWILKDDTNYIKIIEGTYDQAHETNPQEITKQPAQKKLDTPRRDINAMYELYRENKEYVTVRGLEVWMYDLLEQQKMIVISDKVKPELRELAIAFNEKASNDINLQERLIKLFAILMFFDQQNRLNKDFIFQL